MSEKDTEMMDNIGVWKKRTGNQHMLLSPSQIANGERHWQPQYLEWNSFKKPSWLKKLVIKWLFDVTYEEKEDGK